MRACTAWMVCALALASLSAVHSATWWDSAVVYQIYPRSYKDSDGDGIGDLNGITSKLQYLKDLGVDAIWLSPIYKSPMYDFGYDIADYRAIATEYGTMADFNNLMATAKSLGIRVVLDFVPNHTSHESYWFEQSVARNGSYTDYYIWADGKTAANGSRIPPSNWLSVFRKSAWEYNAVRNQYYLHQFVIQQPDINYRSGALQQEMKEVIRFWLDKGVSGFRVDAINFLYEVDPANYGGIYPDEPLSGDAGYNSEDYEYLNHIYTKDLNETYDIVFDWRAVLDEYTTKHNESKIMMTEGYTTLERMMQYYGDGQCRFYPAPLGGRPTAPYPNAGTGDGVRNGSMPFNFIFLGEMTNTSTANDMKTVIAKWMDNMPSGMTANWVNGNHDNTRLATRFGENRVDAMNMLALLLPGVTITYQGEELGMTDGVVSWADTLDPQACNTNDPTNYWKKSRDPARTPFHWDSTTSAGFSNNTKTWLPVASNYQTVNVAVEQAANTSHYKFYKDVVSLKHTSPVSQGALITTAISDTVFAVTRYLSKAAVVGIINLSSETQTVDLSSISNVPQTLKVSASGVSCTLAKGTKVKRNSVSMSGHCSLALENGAYKITTASLLVYSIAYLLYAYVN